jgi:hypothetical protein
MRLAKPFQSQGGIRSVSYTARGWISNHQTLPKGKTSSKHEEETKRRSTWRVTCGLHERQGRTILQRTSACTLVRHRPTRSPYLYYSATCCPAAKTLDQFTQVKWILFFLGNGRRKAKMLKSALKSPDIYGPRSGARQSVAGMKIQGGRKVQVLAERPASNHLTPLHGCVLVRSSRIHRTVECVQETVPRLGLHIHY